MGFATFTLLDSLAWYAAYVARRNRDDVLMASCFALVAGAAILFVRADTFQTAFVFPWMRRTWVYLWQPKRCPYDYNPNKTLDTFDSCNMRRQETIREVRFAAALFEKRLREDNTKSPST